MLNREDLLRIARIIDYDRFTTPLLGMLGIPGFEYEYVQFSIRTKLDTGGFCIIHQGWQKAVVGSAFDPHMSIENMEEKLKYNEIRTRKEMKTSELRTMLEDKPLYFKFDNGIKAVVLPKLTKDEEYKIYLQWSINRNLWVEQRSISFTTPLYKKWFHNDKNTAEDQDWRYLLQLNTPDLGPTNTLYKFFEGVYTDDVAFRLLKGTEIYNREMYPKVETKPIPKRIRYQDKEKLLCVKDPKDNYILRVAVSVATDLVNKGWLYVPKKEWKIQEKQKRKDISDGNRDRDLEKKKDLPRIIRRGSKQKGIQGSPFRKCQTITIEEIDKKDKTLIAQEKVEIKVNIPQYRLVPRTYKDGTFMNWRRVFERNKETWFTVTRDVPIQRKTIKVMQIPSKGTQILKSIMSESTINIEGLLRSTIETPYSKYLKQDSKEGVPRWTKLYADKTIEPVYKTYFVTKRDSHGAVSNITKRKLVK